MPIILKDIRKTYGAHQILDHFHLTIDDGEMIAITGKSGSGKSTLLHIMGLLEPFDQGEFRFHQVVNPSIHSHKATLLRRHVIGYLFQNFALAENESVQENLKWALAYQRTEGATEKMEAALAQVGLPKGILRQKVRELSGGEQQRVAIARMTLKPFQVVLADEPTGSLDTENRDIVIEILRNLNRQGKTVVIVTHDRTVAQACSRMVRLG